jgi:hypothetical protein
MSKLDAVYVIWTLAGISLLPAVLGVIYLLIVWDDKRQAKKNGWEPDRWNNIPLAVGFIGCFVAALIAVIITLPVAK